MDKIVLVGSGGHCKVIIDIINSTNQYEIIGITDVNVSIKTIYDIPIIGDDSLLYDLYSKRGIKNAFICIGALGNLQIRQNLYKMLKKIGYNLPVLAHNSSIISKYANIEEGTAVMPGAIINPGVFVNRNCIINTAAVVEHDCIIGENTHISPNVSIAGGVNLGNNCHIGIGSSIIQNITIGDNVVIGAGSVVINDIENNSTAVGIPARVIKKLESF